MENAAQLIFFHLKQNVSLSPSSPPHLRYGKCDHPAESGSRVPLYPSHHDLQSKHDILLHLEMFSAHSEVTVWCLLLNNYALGQINIEMINLSVDIPACGYGD